MIQILVIEPDQHRCKKLLDMLSFMGYGELAAANCQDALAIAAEHRIDLILVNGATALSDCQNLRELLFAAGMEIPIVAYAVVEQVEMLSKLVDDYLDSPFVASVLNQKIRLAV